MPRIVLVLVPVWIVALATGLGLLDFRSATPGRVSAAPEVVERSDAAETLVFLHPHCPCSRATVAELARALRDKPPGVAVRVMMYEPSSPPPGWTRGPLWDDALALPNVSVDADRDGLLARRFGAETSGHIVAYDAAGELIFSGGITQGRGHEGNNPGRAALVAAWSDNQSAQTGLTRSTALTAPVFGCRLFDANASTGSVVTSADR